MLNQLAMLLCSLRALCMAQIDSSGRSSRPSYLASYSRSGVRARVCEHSSIAFESSTCIRNNNGHVRADLLDRLGGPTRRETSARIIGISTTSMPTDQPIDRLIGLMPM